MVKHYYDDDIASAIRRPNRVVLKVHGTNLTLLRK
jgi:hypothetical protein